MPLKENRKLKVKLQYKVGNHSNTPSLLLRTGNSPSSSNLAVEVSKEWLCLTHNSKSAALSRQLGDIKISKTQEDARSIISVGDFTI